MELHEVLKSAREKKQLSKRQASLALSQNVAGLSQMHLARIEQGGVQKISYDKLKALCNLYDLDVQEIYNQYCDKITVCGKNQLKKKVQSLLNQVKTFADIMNDEVMVKKSTDMLHYIEKNYH